MQHRRLAPVLRAFPNIPWVFSRSGHRFVRLFAAFTHRTYATRVPGARVASQALHDGVTALRYAGRVSWGTRLMEWISTRTGGVTGSGYEPGDEPHRLSDDAEELAEEAGAIDDDSQPPAGGQPGA
jgi:hypothetical protein